MDKKTRPIYMLPPRVPPRLQDTQQLKVKGWKKIFHANGKKKKSGVAIVISYKIDFKTKAKKDTT